MADWSVFLWSDSFAVKAVWFEHTTYCAAEHLNQIDCGATQYGGALLLVFAGVGRTSEKSAISRLTLLERIDCFRFHCAALRCSARAFPVPEPGFGETGEHADGKDDMPARWIRRNRIVKHLLLWAQRKRNWDLALNPPRFDWQR